MEGVHNARHYGVVGDGAAHDQPAALVEQLGADHAADQRQRVIYCPPGVYDSEESETPTAGSCYRLPDASPEVHRCRIEDLAKDAGASVTTESCPIVQLLDLPAAFFIAKERRC